MNYKNVLGWLMVLSSVFISCNYFSGTDNPNDIKEGEAIVAQFYNDVKSQNIAAADRLAADTLKRVIGAGGLGKISVYVNNKLGGFKSYTIIDARSSRSGKNDNTLYKYKVKAVYRKTTVFEYIGLLRQGAASPKIISYDVYSDLLR